jgi:cytochrome b
MSVVAIEERIRPPRPLQRHSEVRRVQVWGLPVRMFHWALAVLVTIALLTGFIAPEWWLPVHTAAGYGIVALLIFRFVWAVFGPEYARVVNMANSLRYFSDYLRGLAVLRPPHYVGHNPVGTMMIFAFFGVFVALVVTGLLMEAGEEKRGPLAGLVTYATGNAAKEPHEILAFVAIGMIVIHIAGVIVESVLQKVNLVRGMIDGWMPVPSGFRLPTPRPARVVAAVVTLVVIAALMGIAMRLLSRLPPHGVLAMPVNQTYQAECGACHWPYHPSLLPRSSWALIMNGLDDHFGEDAMLPSEQAQEIAIYLNTYAAEAWDTEAANRLANVSAEEPTRVTKSPYFVRKHSGIDPAVYERRSIRSRGNCIACHQNANTGRFDDHAIAIPTGEQP